MKKNLLKKIGLSVLSVFALLVFVLGVHIWLVTRPKAPDDYTKIMARINFREDINKEAANKIGSWMNSQQGIDHVLINMDTHIIVFTFFPVKTSADKIVSRFKSNFNLTAERYLPSEEDMKNGCPVASTSYTYKIATFFKHTF